MSRIREAVARNRNSNAKGALKAVNAAIAQRPNDPFLHDLKGEILMDARQFKAAVAAQAKAVKLAPRDGLIQAGYGRALLATDNVKAAKAALEYIEHDTVIGIGTGSTANYFIDMLGELKHKIDGAVAYAR